jgi:hypothetical protein
MTGLTQSFGVPERGLCMTDCTERSAGRMTHCTERSEGQEGMPKESTV